jgi:hypothetical protein
VTKTDLSCFDIFKLCCIVHKLSVLFWNSKMEVLILRFPHLCENIFDQLNNENLAKCIEVSKTWNNYFIKQKFFHCRKIKRIIEKNHSFGEFWKKVLSKANTEISLQLSLAVEKFFVEKDGFLHSKVHHGLTPLHIAASLGIFQIVEYIFQKCEIENIIVKYSKRNLWKIMKHENKNPRNTWKETPLHFAASKGHLKICTYIIDKVEQKNPKCIKGRTPLHYAAISGHLEVCLLIMPKIQDKSPYDVYKFTPLHYAAFHGHLPVCKYILDNVGNKNPKTILGKTPLSLASERGHLQICKYIMDNFADKNQSQLDHE